MTYIKLTFATISYDTLPVKDFVTTHKSRVVLIDNIPSDYHAFEFLTRGYCHDHSNCVFHFWVSQFWIGFTPIVH